MIGDSIHRDRWWSRIGESSDRVADQRYRVPVLNTIWVGAGRPVNRWIRPSILVSVQDQVQDQIGDRR